MNQILIIGLGSMGKRRIRCLLSLGYPKENIIGMDLRADRRDEAVSKYGVRTVSSPGEVDFAQIQAVIVSLPPDKHAVGAKIAIEHGKPVFIEASVVLEDALEIQKMSQGKVYVAPSCTMVYHPMIQEIAKIVRSGKYGKVTNFTYHFGQYLPDWHPWERVSDFYVGKRITGGAREIVPFELTWIVDLLGFPKEAKGYFRKTTELGCDIDDSYAFVLDFGDTLGALSVEVTARYAIRHLILNLEKAQVIWRWDKQCVELYESDTQKWSTIKQPEVKHEAGYNANIDENPYIQELSDFLNSLSNPSGYPNSLEKDIGVLRLLKRVEDSDGGFERA
jgi:predicted dehydrogenase